MSVGPEIERSRTTTWAASALFALVVVLTGVDLTLTTTAGLVSLAEAVLLVPASLAWGAVGSIVSSRRPRNPVGWLLGVVAVLGGLSGASMTYTTVRLAAGPLSRTDELIGWSLPQLFAPSIALVVILLLFFPDGRLVSSRWRPVLWMALVGTGATVTSLYLSPGRLGTEETGYVVPSPIAFPGSGTVKSIADLLIPLLALAGLLAVASLIIRFRSGSTVQRQQLKVVVYSILGAAVSLPPLGLSLRFAFGEAGGGFIGGLLFALAYTVLPVAIAVAVLRYRLFDVGRIVSRTAAYALVVSVLAVGYALMVLILGWLLPVGSDLTVAGSTLLVAALFRPLVARTRRLLDRRFHRSRYDAARTVEAFGMRLRDQIDLAALTGELVAVAGRTVHPTAATVWIRGDASEHSTAP